jgi:hypothetical protein
MTISPTSSSRQSNARATSARRSLKGSSFADVVRVRYILPDGRLSPVGRRPPGLRESRPAATMMVAGLADPRMKIEIEVTAQAGTS